MDPVAADAAAQAAAALDDACLVVRELTGIDDLGELGALIDRIWQRQTPMVETGLLKSFVEAGGYVVGAEHRGRLVGGAVGFLGARPGRLLLHSHIAGFAEGEAGGGRGRALKLHQRAWCLARGIDVIEWTFDPLVRRNAWFNLQRLGVHLERYEANHYGPLDDDGVNGADDSDRWVVAWHLTAGAAVDLAEGARLEPDEELLRASGAADLVDESGRRTGAEPTTALVLVPDDVVALRRDDPEAASRWRRSTRAALEGRLADGERVTGFTRSGRYVVAP